MAKTLYDIKIDKIDLPNELLEILKKHGYDSVGKILTTEKATIQDLGFSSSKATIIRKKAMELGEKAGFGQEQVEKKVGQLLLQNEFLRLIKMDRETLILLESKGVLQDLILYTGVDIVPFQKGNSLPNKLFISSQALKFRKRFKSLPIAAKELYIPHDTLLGYSHRGFLEDGRISHTLFDINWLKENLPRIRKEIKTRPYENSQSKQLWNRLNRSQQTLIEEYLQYRRDSDVVFSRQVYFAQFLKDDAYKLHQLHLVRMFYFIICQRCGIKHYWEKEGFFSYRQLTPLEEELYDPDVFDFDDLNEEDIKALKPGRNSSHTRITDRGYFLGLFYYTLMKKKANINKQQSSFENWAPHQAYAVLMWKAEIIEESFLKYLSVKKYSLKRVSLGKSVYLERQAVAKMMTRILQGEGLGFSNPLKKAAMLAIGFFGIIRPVEIWRMEIDKHLFINKETGLMDTVTIEGTQFGKIFITKEMSKMGLSSSGPYGILLVPRAVKIVNLYLSQLYTRYPHTRGKGYLFRPKGDEWNPHALYASSKTLFDWVVKYKHLLSDILSLNELENFSAYDTRHTGNNLIVKKTFFSDPILDESKKDVAEYHARHKGLKSTNEQFYQESLTLDVYAKVINGALNFPFEQNDLLVWEQNMYNSSNLLPQKHHQMATTAQDNDNNEEAEKIDEQISALKEEMKQLGKRSYLKDHQITSEQLFVKAKSIQKEIDALKLQKGK
ncbi:hypothetical protein [Domibacillus mangrovi]|uniref:Uncharacterized protein n=1 Tax=Domibacillus mangrovi TaxID=1714354 RepID=A0A1Q5P361_9BACI|nr:hypothetical protein [Domibacillus mangrovi]OKL36685.1 hypothetical protein BLL40_08075 [Domibacillus mangrovi]